ncbi:hypothetical protein GEMRC1_008295 [Eukaryota sp. GEM-RC1]
MLKSTQLNISNSLIHCFVYSLDRSFFCWIGDDDKLDQLSISFPSTSESSVSSQFFGKDNSGFITEMANRLSAKFKQPVLIGGSINPKDYESWILVERSLIQLIQECTS